MPAVQPSPPARTTRDVAPIALAFFLVFLGIGAAQPFVVDYLKEVKGLPAAHASFVLSLVYFVFVLFWLLMGRIIRVLGLHATKILGIATYALFPLAIYGLDAYPFFLAASVMLGIGAPMLWTSAMVQVINTSSPERYATASGMVKGAEMSGGMLGALLLASLYVHFGYEALFLTAAGLGVCATLVMAASPRRHVFPDRANLSKFRVLLRHHGAKTVCLLLLSSGFAYGVFLNGMKPHIEVQCGKVWLPWLLPVFGITGILTSVAGGYCCDRIGRWPSFAGAFACGAAGMALAVIGKHPALLLLALAGIGLQNALAPLAALGWLADNTTPDERPQVMGFVMCWRDLGIALTIQLGGFFTNATTTLLCFSALSAVCSLAALRIALSARQTIP